MLERVRRALVQIEDAILVSVLSAMIGFAVLQIVLRNLFGVGIVWADPLVRVLVLWVGLIGAIAAARLDRHIVISALARLLPPRWKVVSRVVTDGATAATCAILAVVATRFVQRDYEAGALAFAAVPAWVCETIVPFAFAVLAARYLLFAVEHLRAIAHPVRR